MKDILGIFDWKAVLWLWYRGLMVLLAFLSIFFGLLGMIVLTGTESTWTLGTFFAVSGGCLFLFSLMYGMYSSAEYWLNY